MKSKDLRRILLCFVALTLFLLIGGYAGRRGYVSLRQTRLVKQARNYIAKSEDAKALLCLRRALGSNPKDVQAARLMADLVERGRSPAALIWRSRVVELAPSSTDDRLALARTALTFRDLLTASNALQGVSETGQKTAGYHNMSGTVATLAGQLASAETHFIEASRLEPTNSAPQLNLAVVRLRQTNSPALAEARTTLNRLATDPVVGCQALRELVGDAIRHRETNEAVTITRRLTQRTNCAFADKLLELDLLTLTRNPEAQSYLKILQREAAQHSAKVFEMGTWQMLKNGPGDALAWLDSLTGDIRTNQPNALMIAQCRTLLKDWAGLQSTLESQNWAELEFVRHAFMTRAMRGQDMDSSAKIEWEQALKRAKGQKESLVMLVRLSTEWNWPTEQEQLLWTFVNQFPSEKWAPIALTQLLYARGRTQALMALFGQQAKANPSDLAIKNNLAMTALLLGAQQLKPYDLAREVYEKASTNASYISTYAFSLHLQEKHAEALKMMEQLGPQDLEKPSMAGYYGVLLQAAGNGEKAKKYLALASKATLLPEETKLFDQARRL